MAPDITRIGMLRDITAAARHRCDWLPLTDPRQDTSWTVRAEAACDLTFDDSAFDTFVKDPSRQVRAALRYNPLLPARFADQLRDAGNAGQEDRDVRALAHPQIRMESLALSVVGPVGLASFPTTPPEMLHWLAAGSPTVAAAVADRPDLHTLPDPLLDLLAAAASHRTGEIVAVCLARNPATPAGTLTGIAAGTVPAAESARRHPAFDLSRLAADRISWSRLRTWALPRLPDRAVATTFAGLTVGWSGPAGALLDASCDLAA